VGITCPRLGVPELPMPAASGRLIAFYGLEWDDACLCPE
jgi:hypothetical protein